MWFPPYNLKFNEDVSVAWNGNDFIGRGEKIYTYTNTERTGNLSFTLLIDHPSIVDYWDRSGLDAGNSGGVDNINNEENTLLRFFAGCSVLKASPQTYQERVAKPKDPSVVSGKTINDKEKPKNEDELPLNGTPNSDANVQYDKAIVCVIYYPNNYSGKDDRSGIVNAVDYLMNGVGTQKYVDDQKNAVDFPVSKQWKPTINGAASSMVRGYEVTSRNSGISVVTEKLQENYNAIKATYADTATKERKAQYLTQANGTSKITVKYGNGGTEYTLAKQIGSNALSLGAAVSPNIDKEPYEWYRRRWYYRVDKDTENQALMSPMSYLDKNSYGLNGKSAYKDIINYKEIMNSFGIDDSNKMELVSFTDMYVALEDSSYINDMLNGCYDNTNVSKIRDIKDNKDKYKIVDVKFYGHASSQGNNPSQAVNEARNDSLAYNRAMTLKKWLESKNFVDSSSATIGMINGVEQGGNKIDVDNEITKMWRSASVVIKYTKADVENAQEVNDKEMEVVELESGAEGLSNKVNTVSQIPEKVSMEGDAIYTADLLNKSARNLLDNNKNKTLEQLRRSSEEVTNGSVTERREGDVNEEEILNKTVHRYDNEGEYFKLLEKNEPFLHHLITEKVKYFDPAFHSISPEGFNARLTFLHQCTRQGSTVGASDINRGNTYNLAFGRPPVCVLRIGDFYYTKIIITSLNITYDQPQWDLNPEGIGVMPMFADIGIRFSFIGGSDLSGPIARLQNAVSFNYYANASVYDDRAERVRYDNKGNETNFKPFVYPDTER